MKYLILAMMLLAIAGCSSSDEPAFKVGDCITSKSNSPKERWETRGNNYTHKILEVGQKKYQVLTFSEQTNRVYKSDRDFLFDDIMKKVECPMELGVFYE